MIRLLHFFGHFLEVQFILFFLEVLPHNSFPKVDYVREHTKLQFEGGDSTTYGLLQKDLPKSLS